MLVGNDLHDVPEMRLAGSLVRSLSVHRIHRYVCLDAEASVACGLAKDRILDAVTTFASRREAKQDEIPDARSTIKAWASFGDWRVGGLGVGEGQE